MKTVQESPLVVQRDYPADKEEEEAIQKKRSVQTHRVTCSDIGESVTWFAGSHDGTITTILRKSPSSLLEINGFFWRWLKNVGGQSAGMPDLKFMGNVFTAAVDKAKVLNQYFCSVFAKENISNLLRLRSLLWPIWSTPSIADVVFDVDEVYKVLCRIDSSKACGPDEIPGRLLREGAPWLAEPISKLYSMSLQSKALPRDWKRANVAQMFKRGNKHSPSNYRPVSLTSLVVKCLEHLVYARLSEFLDVNNRLSSCQHGFRRGHSCQTQLLATTHKWAKSLNRGVSTHVIYLDFSKAFDSVPHQRLLMKLDCIRGNAFS